ncbi:MAG: glycosyltransferase family 2 protein, partial [bacterium]
MPQVSVILPTYNRAHLLLRAVRSVLAQDFDDFELWIIDDESVDNTADVVATINDPRVHYERIAHRGFAGAMNRGLELSRGKYLAFIDSDDEWVPTKLQRQVAVLDSQGPEVGVVYTAGRSFDDVRGRSGGIHHVRIEGVGWLFERLLERPGGIPFPSVLVRRECFARVGHFDETLPVLTDGEG